MEMERHEDQHSVLPHHAKGAPWTVSLRHGRGGSSYAGSTQPTKRNKPCRRRLLLWLGWRSKGLTRPEITLSPSSLLALLKPCSVLFSAALTFLL